MVLGGAGEREVQRLRLSSGIRMFRRHLSCLYRALRVSLLSRSLSLSLLLFCFRSLEAVSLAPERELLKRGGVSNEEREREALKRLALFYYYFRFRFRFVFLRLCCLPFFFLDPRLFTTLLQPFLEETKRGAHAMLSSLLSGLGSGLTTSAAAAAASPAAAAAAAPNGREAERQQRGGTAGTGAARQRLRQRRASGSFTGSSSSSASSSSASPARRPLVIEWPQVKAFLAMADASLKRKTEQVEVCV